MNATALDEAAAAPGRRPGRALVFGLLAAGGLLAVVAGAQPWWRAQASGTEVAFTGTDVSGGLTQALGVVLVVGTVLGLSLRVLGRRILAALLGLSAVAVVALGASRARPSTAAVTDRVRQVTLSDQFDLAPTPWSFVYLAAGLVALGGALALVWAAGRWPRRPARFERTREAAAAALDADDPDGAAAWQAQDAGLDPTDDGPLAGGSQEPPATRVEPRRPPVGAESTDSELTDPDVRGAATRATMEPNRGTHPGR